MRLLIKSVPSIFRRNSAMKHRLGLCFIFGRMGTGNVTVVAHCAGATSGSLLVVGRPTNLPETGNYKGAISAGRPVTIHYLKFLHHTSHE
jgi:hypothetical protein